MPKTINILSASLVFSFSFLVLFCRQSVNASKNPGQSVVAQQAGKLSKVEVVPSSWNSGHTFQDNEILPDFQGIQVQPSYETATAQDGLCAGTFSHPVGNVVFNYDTVSGRLGFSLRLSPSTRSLLGSPVTVAMVDAVVGWYKINPPYVPHIRPADYDFHGSIYRYNRRGSSAQFTIRRGDRVVLTWFIASNTRRAIATRAVSCIIP